VRDHSADTICFVQKCNWLCYNIGCNQGCSGVGGRGNGVPRQRRI